MKYNDRQKEPTAPNLYRGLDAVLSHWDDDYWSYLVLTYESQRPNIAAAFMNHKLHEVMLETARWRLQRETSALDTMLEGIEGLLNVAEIAKTYQYSAEPWDISGAGIAAASNNFRPETWAESEVAWVL